MAIGGYTTVLLSADQHWNLIATLPVSLGISFVCGLLVGVPALRLSGVYLALATFALAISVPQLPLKFSKFLGGSNGRRDIPRLLRLYQEGKLKLDELVTRTYGLEEVNQAFADLERGENARGVITFPGV